MTAALPSSLRSLLPPISKNFCSRARISQSTRLSFAPTRLTASPRRHHLPTTTTTSRSVHTTRSKDVPPLSDRPCWRCGAASPPERSLCVDPECKVPLPLTEGLSYFDVLLGRGKITFDVDLKALKASFLRIQQGVHPDAHSQKSNREHEFAEDQSSFVNKAYRVLKDPVQRALYMLELYGKPIGEDASLAEKDAELLMEVMEYREQVEEAGQANEAQAIQAEVGKKFVVTLKAVSESFAAKDLENASKHVTRLRYYRNIEKAAEDRAFQLSN